MQLYTLIMTLFLAISKALHRQNWDEAVLVLILLHKREKQYLKCLCAF